MAWYGARSMWTMPSQPKPLPQGSLHLRPHLNHLNQLWGASRGAYKDLSHAGRFLLLNQPPQPEVAQPAATPPSSRRPARSAANRNSAPRAVQQPSPAPGRTTDNSRPGQQLRHSARLTPRACAINSPPQPAAAQLRSDHKMAQTYPLSLGYHQCLGSKEDPYSFSSIFLEDLHSGHQEYLVTIQQLIDALPKSLDPTLAFCAWRTGHPSRATTSASFDASRIMVALTIRWGVPESTEWNPVLFGMPGTACGLARG